MASGFSMAEFPVRVVFDVFVGALLALSAVLVLGRARRFPGNALLATFLALVGVNFLASAMTTLTGEPAWDQLAYVVLALDPVFLVAFVAVHPYPRWTRARVALLAWLGLVAAVSIPVILLRPEWVIAYTFDADMRSPARLLLLVGGLAVGYAAAWSMAILSLRDAPTPGLAQRALWTALAVGVAVLPRVPLVPNEVGLLDARFVLLEPPLAPGPEAAWRLLMLLAQVGIAFALLRPAVRQLRAARTPTRQTRRLLRGLGAVVVGLLSLQAALLALGAHAGPGLYVPNIPFAFRWVVFAAILAYAVSVHQVLPMPDSSRAALPVAGGLVLAVGAGLVALPPAWNATADGGLTVAVAAGIGAAALVPGMLLTRKALEKAERLPAGYADVERRFVLYRAALESAWARGRPGPEAAQRLARLRLEFGLSREEAKVLEHVVRDSLRQAEEGLLTGREAFPGVLVREVLGAGSQGRTYLAEDLSSGARVVVKQLRAVASPEARKRLRAELHALGRMDHPAVPRLLDFTLEPSPLLLYPYVDGRPLADLLRAGPLPEAQARRLAADLGDALEHVHGHGVAHGDVKPENVLVAPDGRAALIDFGLVQDDAGAGLRGTIAGLDGLRVAGTLAYMAPERARGAAGPAADWYSLGLTLAEALTGRPRRRVAGLPLHKALEAVSEGTADLSDVPAPWRPLLEGLLDPDPRRRARGVRLPAPAAGSQLGDQERAPNAQHVP